MTVGKASDSWSTWIIKTNRELRYIYYVVSWKGKSPYHRRSKNAPLLPLWVPQGLHNSHIQVPFENLKVLMCMQIRDCPPEFDNEHDSPKDDSICYNSTLVIWLVSSWPTKVSVQVPPQLLPKPWKVWPPAMVSLKKINRIKNVSNDALCISYFGLIYESERKRYIAFEWVKFIVL